MTEEVSNHSFVIILRKGIISGTPSPLNPALVFPTLSTAAENAIRKMAQYDDSLTKFNISNCYEKFRGGLDFGAKICRWL